MITRSFQEKKLPFLGLGCMRLPLLPGGKSGDIDEAAVAEMVECAMEAGVNYFDTAYPYHDGKSETVMGKILSRYPRESYYLADKYPGHQIAEEYRPAEIFEEQLNKCGVEYFDFYLLHNVFEKSAEVYNDPRWGIVEYFVEQKRLGRIRHLGFSTHGSLSLMRAFLEKWGEHLEFCQIQHNYLDHTLQNAAAKVELLREFKMPIWVMEPLRGGKLASLSEENLSLLCADGKKRNAVEEAFRFFHDIPEIKVVLSGMSSLEQLKDNIRYFEKENPLSLEEKERLFAIAENIKNSVPCTACGYCLKGCPKGIDIPLMISCFNELQVSRSFNVSMRLEFLPREKKPNACIACGKCSKICPQGIAIPHVLKKLDQTLQEMPSWVKICRERAKIAEKESI